jgi:hypothetical protein
MRTKKLTKISINFFIIYTIIFFLTIFFFKSQFFFLNIYLLMKNNLTIRMISKYGDCDKQGYGFIHKIYLKKKTDNNIKVYNKENYPSSNFFFYNSNKILSNKYIILINYTLLDVEKLNIKYQILYKEKQCYLIKLIND